MMNVRIKNPDAGRTSKRLRSTETRNANNIPASRTRYGKTEVPRSNRLRLN
jgi:hypothetical protein